MNNPASMQRKVVEIIVSEDLAHASVCVRRFSFGAETVQVSGTKRVVITGDQQWFSSPNNLTVIRSGVTFAETRSTLGA